MAELTPSIAQLSALFVLCCVFVPKSVHCLQLQGYSSNIVTEGRTSLTVSGSTISVAANDNGTQDINITSTTATTTTEPPTTIMLEEEMTLEDPDTGVVIVNVSQSYIGYACPPLFAYRSSDRSYLVVTSCTGTRSQAIDSCVAMGSTLAGLPDDRVAAAASFAATMEQGVRVYSKSTSSARRTVAEFTFWTAPAITLPWDTLLGSAEDSTGQLEITIYDSGEPPMYEWTTSVYSDTTSAHFWLCETNSTIAGKTITTTTESTLQESSTISSTNESSPSSLFSSSTNSTIQGATLTSQQQQRLSVSTISERPTTARGTTEDEPVHDAPVYSSRKKGSVMDDRPSAIFIGTAGITIIVTIVSAIVLMDLSSVYRAYKRAQAKALKKRRRSSRSPRDVSRSGSVCTVTSELTLSDIDGPSMFELFSTPVNVPTVPPTNTLLD